MGCGLWWLWWLWIVGMVVVEWVATLGGFQFFFFFFFWLWISFDFGLLMVVDLHGRR